MQIIKKLTEWLQRSNPFAPIPSRSYSGWADALSVGPRAISEEAALCVSAVYCAVRCISEAVGTMPCKVYSQAGDIRAEARDHELWAILHDEPNSEQSAVDFFSLMQFWACLWGNAYAEVQRRASGQTVALWPIPPWACQVIRGVDGNIIYNVSSAQGGVQLQPQDVIHIRGLAPLPGGEGYRLVQLARTSLNYSLQLDQFGEAYFANKCNLGGFFVSPNKLGDDAMQNIRKSWMETYTGVEQTAKIAVLEEGLEFKPLPISNEAGQYTESRTFQIYEACRYFRIDPIFLYEYGRATWNNAESQTRNFLQFSLNPWLKKWEAEFQRKCFVPSDRLDYYAEFLRESVIQMDAKTQAEVWTAGVNGGWLDANKDIRRALNKPPLPPKPPVAPPVVPAAPNPQDKNGNPPNQQ